MLPAACEVAERSSPLSDMRAGTAVSCFSKMPTCTATYAQDTQASSHDQLQTKLPPVPDLENRRYCRACQIMLPVMAFPAGKRRYLCKRHIWERVQRPSKERARANVDKRRLWTIWKTCYHDAMRTFKHRRILLLQRDIKQTLAQIDAVADFVESNADVNQDVHQMLIKTFIKKPYQLNQWNSTPKRT